MMAKRTASHLAIAPSAMPAMAHAGTDKGLLCGSHSPATFRTYSDTCPRVQRVPGFWHNPEAYFCQVAARLIEI